MDPLTAKLALGCVWLGWTSEFFESEDNVLQDFDVRDLVYRWVFDDEPAATFSALGLNFDRWR